MGDDLSGSAGGPGKFDDLLKDYDPTLSLVARGVMSDEALDYWEIERKVQQEIPWCTCKHDRQTGYVRHPDHPEEFLVHSTCMKPTRTYWQSKQG